METRPYFIFGDIISVAIVGVICSLACSALIGSGWNMLIAMLVGMAVGMVLAFIIAVVLLSWLFGAMEIMVPTMLTGMFSAMIVSMQASMSPLSNSAVIQTGLLVAIVTLVMTYLANLILAGVSSK